VSRHARILFLVLVCFLVLACGPLAAGTPVPATSVPATLPTNPTPTSGVVSPAAPETPIAPDTPAPVMTPAAANSQIARQHLVALSEDIGARPPGSPGEAEATQYVQAAFEALGYETQLQPFSFTTEDEDTLDSANVIAVKIGSSPREIIVGAHYDSGDEGEGADDNASGVAVMLEVAEKIKDVETPYTIRFIAFGAEENDLDGSRYYVDQMSASEIQNTVGMINLDSLIAGDIAYVYGDAGAGSLRDWILAQARGAGFDLEARTAQELDNLDGTPCDCADYGPFQAAGIPFAYFEATNWNLGEEDGYTQVDPAFGEEGVIRHTGYDTVSDIDSLFPGRIEHHLNLFVTLLHDTLTQFTAPD
jgi:alkaline phosphatase isozyme conversion protein